MKAEEADRILGLDGGDGAPLKYDDGGILPYPRKPSPPIRPPLTENPDEPLRDLVGVYTPEPVVDTITRPTTNGTNKTTTTTEGKGFNWGALALFVCGLWVVSQLGKEQ